MSHYSADAPSLRRSCIMLEAQTGICLFVCRSSAASSHPPCIVAESALWDLQNRSTFEDNRQLMQADMSKTLPLRSPADNSNLYGTWHAALACMRPEHTSMKANRHSHAWRAVSLLPSAKSAHRRSFACPHNACAPHVRTAVAVISLQQHCLPEMIRA